MVITARYVIALPQFNALNVLKAIKGGGQITLRYFLATTPAGSHICSSDSCGGIALAQFLSRNKMEHTKTVTARKEIFNTQQITHV